MKKIANTGITATYLRSIAALSLIIGLAVSCPWIAGGTPPDWMQPGLRVGSGRLGKRLFLNLDGIGTVTDIQPGALQSPGTFELGVAGLYGATFFDKAKKPTGKVAFAVRRPGGFDVSSKIVKGTNGLAFFREAGAAATYDSLVDAGGKEIWRTPYIATAATFGDLSGDGVPEFVIAGEDYAIEARKASGEIIWRTPPGHTVFQMSFLAPEEGEGAMLLVDESGSLVGLGPHGGRLFERDPAAGESFSDLSPIRWPTVCQGQCLLVSQKEKLVLLARDGKRVIGELPGKYVYHALGIPVRLYDSEPPLLAVVGLLTYRGSLGTGWQDVGSELYIFDSKMRIVYDEVLPERAEAVSVLPTIGSKRESLLVGGENRVWEYDALSATM
jgi:hypothetical protein